MMLFDKKLLCVLFVWFIDISMKYPGYFMMSLTSWWPWTLLTWEMFVVHPGGHELGKLQPWRRVHLGPGKHHYPMERLQEQPHGETQGKNLWRSIAQLLNNWTAWTLYMLSTSVWTILWWHVVWHVRFYCKIIIFLPFVTPSWFFIVEHSMALLW